MNKIILLFLSLYIISCQNSIDFEAEKKKIQAQVDLVEKAHFTKDAIQFYKPNAESWFDIRQGTIILVNKSDEIATTQSYLDNMEFQELIKRDDPIIEISDDGSMASYIGSVTVKGKLNGEPVFWVVAWQSVLKNIDNEWKIISSANTEADQQTSAKVLLDLVRNNLGDSSDIEIISIYANAECRGPELAFKTLILSRETDGRMEQVYNGNHVIMKHGRDSSWTYDVNSNSINESMDKSTKMFIQGHELHWLSFWPEHRYFNPQLKEITNFNNQTAFKIEFNNSMHRTINFYYSFDTYTPLGFELNINDSGDIVTTLFEEWEIINGISIFKKATFQQGDEIFEYNFVDIKLNQLADKDFESKIGLIE